MVTLHAAECQRHVRQRRRRRHRQQGSAAGWYVINGTIGADGALVLSGSGISGLKGYEGRPFNVSVRGTMSEGGYEGSGLFGRRNCSILLTRIGN